MLLADVFECSRNKFSEIYELGPVYFLSLVGPALQTYLKKTKVEVQWTLSISTILYLEYLSISNKMFGPLKFLPRTLHSLSLF